MFGVLTTHIQRKDARMPQSSITSRSAVVSPRPHHVEALVLGSGQGGKLLAWHLARSGRKVAAVERQWVGGSCPAVACLPSKNEIWGAHVAHLARRGAQFGTITGPVSVDMAQVRQRKRDMVDREIAFHLNAYETSGAELIMGSGHFVGPRTLQVELNAGGMRELTADQIFINVGTHAAMPPIPGLKDARPLTHIEALELDRAPQHLIIIGGGYVAIEMAQAFRRFGSRVTVIERDQRLMPREDADISDAMQQVLADEGVAFHFRAEISRVEGLSGEGVRLAMRTLTGEQSVEGTDLLVATGRVPNTDGLGLAEAGVALDERGYIRVNERLETSAPGVWAMGEVASGNPQFTHVSVDDFRIIRDNLAGGSRSTADRLVPHVLFNDPPLARIGLSEAQARAQGMSVRVAKLPMSNVLRTEATDETQGFMKVLVDAFDDHVVGFAMVGSEAGEVMAAVQTAMLAGLPFPKLRDAVFAHLTIAEGLGPLFSNVPPRASH
jgi:pyruvate/2-oxoglutarate dehydrogenase complex dihydrolipoamide dehydrogenase (E3) component